MENYKYLIENSIHQITDENLNKWKVIELSDLDEIMEAYHQSKVKTLGLFSVSCILLPTTLMRIHPELTYSEAESLMEFAKSKKVTYEECYGDGSTIYPMWKEANYR